MSVEANKETVRRFIDEVVNQHQLQAAQELATQDYINHDPTSKAMPGVTQNVTGYRTAFPIEEVWNRLRYPSPAGATQRRIGQHEQCHQEIVSS
jgi:predicted SnoaL-like aldol condensation-catalyzing enzyme